MTALLLIIGAVYVLGAIAFPVILRHVIYGAREWLLTGLLWPWWLGGLAFWFVATELWPWRR